MKKIFILILFVIGLLTVGFFINSRSSSSKQIEKISQSIQDVITTEDSFIVAAAADIVCSTVESAQECKYKETADLIDNKNPQIVLGLGDLQYPKGEYSNFQNFYDKTWGKFKDNTNELTLLI